MNLLWFDNLILMRLWVWNAYLVLLWNRALAYPRALLPSGGHLSREFWQLTTPLIKIVSYSKLCLSIFPHKARFSRGRRPRPCWISVKTIYWSGDFQERFFLFDPSLTSGTSAALMQGHCIRRRPCIKQHMSGGPESNRKYHRQLPPHLTRHKTLHAAGLD